MVDTIVAFRLPPVVEVVAGVAFDLRGNDVAPMLAAFWKERLRHEFPNVQLQPPYSSPIEELDDPLRGAFDFAIDLGVPSPRLWALSSAGQEVLQLQPGWFACNWRRAARDSEYDRWRSRRSAFERWFQELAAFMDAEGMKPLRVTQCEVTYINHIRPNRHWARHDHYDKVFDVKLPFLEGRRAEQLTLDSSYVLHGADNGRVGRLHVKIIPAFDRDGASPIYVLELTARGTPRSDDLTGALSFMDLGRAAIDRTFVALTSDAMHQEWERQT